MLNQDRTMLCGKYVSRPDHLNKDLLFLHILQNIILLSIVLHEVETHAGIKKSDLPVCLDHLILYPLKSFESFRVVWDFCLLFCVSSLSSGFFF